MHQACHNYVYNFLYTTHHNPNAIASSSVARPRPTVCAGADPYIFGGRDDEIGAFGGPSLH